MRETAANHRIKTWLKRYWFFLSLLALCVATAADASGILAASGAWLKAHRGPDMVVVCIFLFSGFSLSPEQLKDGLMDVKGTLLAFTVIFVAAPLAAIVLSRIPLDTGIVIGLFLVAAMPSTLSSGVVMTAAAGGSAAHALVTTIAANSLAVFTIPYCLSLLLMTIGLSTAVTIDKAAIMLKIGMLVILPLAAGMTARHFWPTLLRRLEPKINLANQFLILFVVWIALSQTRDMLVGGGATVAIVVTLAVVYHGLLLLAAWGLVRLAGRERGRRESVLFMGGQKTLPLSIILQMSLFPQYGVALIVCVLHHIVHLMMDGYLVERLRDG